MKDCLQLEGDIHILGERIGVIQHEFKELSKKFDLQITEIGKKITDIVYEHISKNYQDSERKNGNFKNELLGKFNELESYIKNERFHNILTELNKLEDEYHNKAVKIVKKMATKK